MQDLDRSKCDSILVGTEGRLVDKRDNKIYWVARIKNAADDNALCWMTQNLDYDGGAVEGYNGGDVAMLQKTTTSFGVDGSTTQKYYYDPGNYVYTLRSGMNKCANQGLATGLSGCVNNGWIGIDELQSSWTVTDEEYFIDATNYIGVDGQSICNKEAGAWLGNSTYPQCRMYYGEYTHYLAGNYYNWPAATNGTGTPSITSGEAGESICPTGWSLPLSGDDDGSNNSEDGSFYKLVNGLNNAQVAIAPYYFIYTGSINVSTLYNASSNGQYWSATAHSASAYSLSVGNGGIKPSSSSARSYGFSVRCVAR